MAELDPQFAKAIVDQCMGDEYADSTLDLKTRALCTVAALVATGDQQYAANWIGNSLAVGATRDEILALLRQLFFYIGTPRTVAGYEAAALAFSRHHTTSG
jgi:4-carboxymuconolactone decarboxylase